MAAKRDMGNWFVLSGVAAGLFYFLHVLLGQLAYPGYDWLRQAVSDLTAADSPARGVASAFSFLYGLFSCVACTVLCLVLAGKTNLLFRLGVYLYAIMNFVSFAGYTLFPLSGSGFQGQFQDIMHLYVVTLGVVLCSIASLVLMGLGGFRPDGPRAVGALAFLALLAMCAGSIGMGAAPKELFGLFERFSVFSVVAFTTVLGIFGFGKKPDQA